MLSSEVIQPLSLVRCYPIGVITMLDQGRLDEKIIAIPFEDPSYNSYHDVSELPAHLFTEISHFFSVYKSLEGKETVVDELRGKDAAREVIQKCLDAYIETFISGFRDSRAAGPPVRTGRPFGSVRRQSTFPRRRIRASGCTPDPSGWRCGCRWGIHRSSCRE